MDTANPLVAAQAAPSRGGRVRPGRVVADRVLRTGCLAATLVGALVLGSILLMLIIEGLRGFTPTMFTEATPGPGSEGGGIANAILGSFVLTGIGIAVATPIGVMAGTYLAEYGRTSRLAGLIRFLNDILLSAPSILIGLFVYTLMVRPMGSYSGWAGGVALAIIAVPVIVRTTEDMLRLVPGTLREAGAALGAPASTVITSVTWRAASAGIVTGIILALARIAGETAPLLFTALNNNDWGNVNLVAAVRDLSPDKISLMGGVANLPVMIYQFALSPYPNWQGLAWAGALLITAAILALSILARIVINPQRSH